MDESQAMPKQGRASWRPRICRLPLDRAKVGGRFYKFRPWNLPFGPSFGCSNLFPKDWSFAYGFFLAKRNGMWTAWMRFKKAREGFSKVNKYQKDTGIPKPLGYQLFSYRNASYLSSSLGNSLSRNDAAVRHIS